LAIWAADQIIDALDAWVDHDFIDLELAEPGDEHRQAVRAVGVAFEAVVLVLAQDHLACEARRFGTARSADIST